jgi:MoaA/NifB/PqqE/SkfB family radical SAM enzyme
MNVHRLVFFQGDHIEYRFCSPRWRQSRRPVLLEVLKQDLARIDPRRCQRLVLSGGNPPEHPDFPTVLAQCRERGFSTIALETDGTGLEAHGAVESLVDSGLEQVFFICGGHRDESHRLVLQDERPVREVLAVLRRLAATSLETYVVVPVVRENLAAVPAFLDWVIGLGGVRGFLLSIPDAAQVPPAARSSLLPFAALAKLAHKVFGVARVRGLEYGFAVARGLPPCATGTLLDEYGSIFHERITYFQHRPADEVERVGACAECVLRHCCNGIERAHVATFGDRGFHPVSLEHATGWKLRPLNRLDRKDYQHVSAFDNAAEPGMGLIRLNGHCNMSCSFCFVDRTVQDFPFEELQRAVDVLVGQGTRHLILSGGEPTLHPQLAEVIRYARERGVTVIEMQTNGVLCAERDYAQMLVQAGLTMVTVSLHSVDPARSDSYTRLPNSFAKTMQAIHHFRDLGVTTQIACVITRLNYAELPEYVRFLHREFPPEGGHLSICFGIAQGISDLVFPWVIPRFSEIKGAMREALDFCLEQGIGFGGMIGQGGYPPCMLDGDLRYYRHVMTKIYRSPGHEREFYKAPRCRECAFDAYCLGVRASYVRSYGDEELVPLGASGQ